MDAYTKNFIMLDRDLECGCRNISSPIIRKPILHSHDGYEMLLFLGGEVEFYTEGESKILERGDCFCIKPYDFHHVRLISPDVYDRVVINFRETVLQRISSEATNLGRCFQKGTSGKLHFFHVEEEMIQSFFTKAKELQESLENKNFGSDVFSYSLLAQILVLANRCMDIHVPQNCVGTMPQLVSDTFAYIEQHLTEELSLAVLEKQLQYSGTYISRCFRRTMGISLQQYIIAKRLTLAQQYLQQGISPCDVCFLTGFNNYSNFSRTFQQYMSISPKKYQVRNQNK